MFTLSLPTYCWHPDNLPLPSHGDPTSSPVNPAPHLQVAPGSTYEVNLGSMWSSMGLMEDNLLSA